MTEIRVRPATPTDHSIVCEFNALLAHETENKSLDATVLSAGVEAALRDPNRLHYWVAEIDGNIVGQTAVTTEWSDWRNGWIWWFQSVYVKTQQRGLGVFRALFRGIESAARQRGDVIGLRLYVEEHNRPAIETYAALGMKRGGYLVYEQFWIELS